MAQDSGEARRGTQKEVEEEEGRRELEAMRETRHTDRCTVI